MIDETIFSTIKNAGNFETVRAIRITEKIRVRAEFIYSEFLVTGLPLNYKGKRGDCLYFLKFPMKIFRIRWKSFLENFPPPFLLTVSVGLLVSGGLGTHWAATYREGDSIIPREGDLTRVGPLFVSKAKRRTTPFILFSDGNGNSQYRQDMFQTTANLSAVDNLVKSSKNRATAYLFVYKKNPVREIWKITIQGVEVLSYQDALSYYNSDNFDGYSRISLGLVGLILFFASMIEVRHTKKVM
ncbi:hypothetical protein [Burkholderia gladioli]|uniref:hypothetical protein n=1 Tax=Burkholderia gladioli TaxID=28095 RepID=UPI00163E6EE0|nr:hypothetical protein [Burkholderia gladioli]